MKKIILNSEIEELSPEELDHIEQALLSRAQTISKLAYAPYSNFNVGAALLLENGEVLQSSNQENVSYPVGTCAERIVLGYAGANYPTSAPVMLAIVAHRAGEEKWAGVSPCGMCRQAINETENRFKKPITMLILSASGTVLRIKGISALLPIKFDDLNSAGLEY
ncbi:MAG: cytidine deaminase [Algoriphagus sp.]|uniref:cytidine deaminase n=1 Tax=Algoriphagus sp. TaxID=1872435 RepID=UPI0027258EEA|nr:cytidine deaminase [Algoriphagus sp.]MDO8965565.1 cytidine deaminase [Algoriphagus sp.]MDP2039882.1 cytidine deaminase [Algoriphagus sp.]MDP3201605.1 cytidine deaminase [Algoriphagus sp.]MDP3473922.1 cytidine deaminase [Algoriphagus sp.]